MDDVDISKLQAIPDILLSSNEKYTADQLAKLLNIDVNEVNQLYSLIDYITGNTKNWIASPNEFVKLILENSTIESIKENINEQQMKQIQLLSTIMQSSLSNTSYTYQELSQFIGIDINNTKNIYTLYVSSQNNTKLTPQEFVNFVLEHKNETALSGSIQNKS